MATIEKAAAADEASPDGEPSSGRGKRVQRSRRPTLAVLEASAGDLSDTDMAAQPEPAEVAADEADLQDYEPEGMPAAPTSPPPSAKRKRSRARPVPAAAEDEAGLPEAALRSGPGADVPMAQLEHPPAAEDGVDMETVAPEPSQTQTAPAGGPPSAKGQRTRARQPPAKFQPTFSPDRPAPKRASKAAATVGKAEPPAAAGAPGGSSKARRSRGTAAKHADVPAPRDAGVAEAAAANGPAPAAATASAAVDADAQEQPDVPAVLKRGARNKQGSRATAASARLALLAQSCVGSSCDSGSQQYSPHFHRCSVRRFPSMVAEVCPDRV